MQTLDLFCRVIDNFGDIGVCWRLARQLGREYPLTIRLWLDDFVTGARLIPGLPALTDEALSELLPGGVAIELGERVYPQASLHILPWSHAEQADVQPAQIVIEAFACELPSAYLHAMQQASQPPLWLNLEYLSAEAWVESCHGLSSPQPPLHKTFFFPGFTISTGGLLREQDLLTRRDAYRQSQPPRNTDDPWRISLFCYENPELPAMLDGLLSYTQQQQQRVTLYVPEGKILPQLCTWLSLPPANLSAHAQHSRDLLEIHILPMTDQDGYDQLLWSCDLNFVRGEDSLVRAIWAGVPLVWHIYPQEEQAHHDKLEAFLSQYPPPVHALQRRWNGLDEPTPYDWAQGFSELFKHWPEIQQQSADYSQVLATQGNLALNLMKFTFDKLK